jgi:hypothetical protein
VSCFRVEQRTYKWDTESIHAVVAMSAKVHEEIWLDGEKYLFRGRPPRLTSCPVNDLQRIATCRRVTQDWEDALRSVVAANQSISDAGASILIQQANC